MIDRTRIEQLRRVQAAELEACGDAVAFLLSQVDALDRALAHWQANHGDLAKRAALLSQRPDLPVDRLPAYREMERLQLAARPLFASALAVFDAGPWRYHHEPQASEHVHRYFVESGDFTHDVRLYVNGDFADDIEHAVYGHALAATLNHAAGMTMSGRDSALRLKLIQASAGACTCLTKSAEAQHHADTCSHRYIQEALDLLAAQAAEAVLQVRDTAGRWIDVGPRPDAEADGGDGRVRTLYTSAAAAKAAAGGPAWLALQSLKNPYNRAMHGENWHVAAHAWDEAIISAMRAVDALGGDDDLVALLRQLRTELEAQDVLFEWWGILDAALGESAG